MTLRQFILYCDCEFLVFDIDGKRIYEFSEYLDTPIDRFRGSKGVMLVHRYDSLGTRRIELWDTPRINVFLQIDLEKGKTGWRKNNELRRFSR
jgi:hypothetical protein